MDISTLSNTIKVNTKDLHQALEKTILLKHLSNPNPIKKTDYKTILIQLYTHLYPLEQTILKHQKKPFLCSLALPFEPRFQYLQQDLYELNINHTEIKTIDRLETHPSNESLIGTLYLLEGTKLGNHVIAKKLIRDQSTLPMRYFKSAHSTQNWPIFCDTINRITDLDIQQAILSVKKIYKNMIVSFNQGI